MAAAMTMQTLNDALGEFLRIHVIVDSSVIFADLIAVLRKNSTGRRRPAVLELVAKRTFVGYFPQEKLAEMEEKCREISARYNIPLPEVEALWRKYQAHLHIVPTRDLERERADSIALTARDPTDVAFVQARHIVGASLVLSNDPDIRASGAPVMPWSQILLDLRYHARKEGMRAAVFFGTGTAIVVPVIAIIGLVHLIFKALKTIPRQALVMAAVGLGIALIIPKSRQYLIDAGKCFLEGLSTFGKKALPLVDQALAAATRAEKDAATIRPQLDKDLRAALRKRLTMTQAVYRACLVSNKPLTVAEVWAIAFRDGARCKGKHPLKSVLRALQRHPLLASLPDGRWQVAPILTDTVPGQSIARS